KLLAIKLMLAHEKGQNSGIDRARARSHHQPIQRSESHRRIYAAAVVNRCQRTSAPQVSGHEFERRWILAQRLSRASGTILMIDAMKSGAPNAALEPLIGPGISCRSWRQCAMESGIENRHLRN